MPLYPYGLPHVHLKLVFTAEKENDQEGARNRWVEQLDKHLKKHKLQKGGTPKAIEAAVDAWFAKEKAEVVKSKSMAGRQICWDAPVNEHRVTVRLSAPF